MGVLVSRQVGCVQFPIIHLPLCSGRGRCVLEVNGTESVIDLPNFPGSQCVCDPGWSGYNDYLNMHTHDCGINTATIYVIWSLILLSCIVTLAICIQKLIFSLIRFRMIEDQQRQLGERFRRGSTSDTDSSQRNSSTRHSKASGASSEVSLGKGGGGGALISKFPQHPSLSSSPSSRLAKSKWRKFFKWRIVTVSLLTCIPALGMMSAAIYRLAHVDRPYASDLGMTILFMSGGIPFWTAYRNTSRSWLKVRKKLIRFTPQDRDTAHAAINRLQKTLRLAVVPELFEILLSILLCYQQEHANLIIFIYFHIQFLTMSLSCYAFLQAARCLETLLSSGIQEMMNPSEKLNRDKALKRVRRLIYDEKQIMKGAIPFTLLVAWWPFLRSKHAYSWFQMALGNFTLIQRVWLVHPPELEDMGTAADGTHSSHTASRSNHATVKRPRSRGASSSPSSPTETIAPPSASPSHVGRGGLGRIAEMETIQLGTIDGSMILDLKITGDMDGPITLLSESNKGSSTTGIAEGEIILMTPPESPVPSITSSPHRSIRPQNTLGYEPVNQLDTSYRPSLSPSTSLEPIEPSEPSSTPTEVPIFNPFR